MYMAGKGNKPLVFSQQEKEFIDGAMLGDGCISKSVGKSSQFVYTTSKLSHAEYVYRQLRRMAVNANREGPIRRDVFDHRTQKTYISYKFRTIQNITFFELRRRWYPEGKKIIPRDVQITPLSSLIWYVGDGCLMKSGRSQYIKLSTHSFEKKQLEENILPKLDRFTPHLVKCDKKGQFYIYIPRKTVPLFLEWIGDCPVSEYSYKWDLRPYKYPNVLARGGMLEYHNYDEIIDAWKTGEYTIYGLSKKYGVPIKCIKRELNKRKVGWKPIDNRKRIVQCDLLDNPLKTWYSGQQVVKELGFSANMISRCCRGVITEYKGYKWKFEMPLEIA